MLEESPFKRKGGARQVDDALSYSLAGLSSAWQHEAAFRHVLLLAIVGIATALAMRFTAWAQAAIIVSHFTCIVVELINSAIEAAVDHTSLKEHPLAKRAKDLGSAAQLVSLAALVLVWGIALADKLHTNV
jgi:diacylglycerol kinase (ATP)